MGEIADALINGEFDYITGEYIGRGCGYPRTGNNYRKKKSKPSAINLTTETQIVWHFLKQRGLLHDSQKSDWIKKYAVMKGIPALKVSDICKVIRTSKESWKEFTKWFDSILLTPSTEKEGKK